MSLRLSQPRVASWPLDDSKVIVLILASSCRFSTVSLGSSPSPDTAEVLLAFNDALAIPLLRPIEYSPILPVVLDSQCVLLSLARRVPSPPACKSGHIAMNDRNWCEPPALVESEL
jgi:hypothetical protein